MLFSYNEHQMLQITELGQKVWLFIKNIPHILKETFIWLLLTYLLPLVNISILGCMNRYPILTNLNVLNIVLVTNGCFLTSILSIFLSNKNKRKLMTTLCIAFYVVTITLFIISIIQIEFTINIFDIKIYQWGTVVTSIISVIIALLTKYDETMAESVNRADESRKIDETLIEGKEVKL